MKLSGIKKLNEEPMIRKQNKNPKDYQICLQDTSNQFKWTYLFLPREFNFAPHWK